MSLGLIWDAQRLVGVVVMVITVPLLAFAVATCRRPGPVRLGLDLTRLAVSVAAIVLMARLTGVATEGLLVVAALGSGGLLGLAQGWMSRPQVQDGRVLVRRSAAGVAAWGIGILAMQTAGVLSRSGTVRTGQAISLFGVGVLGGLLVGRQPRLVAARLVQVATKPPTFLILVVTTIVVLSVTGESGQAAEDIDVWTMIGGGPTINPAGAPTDFVGGDGNTTYFGEARFAGKEQHYSITATSITSVAKDVDHDVVYADVSTTVDFSAPPSTLTPGETITLAASGTMTGTITNNANPAEIFSYRSTGVRLKGPDTFSMAVNTSYGDTPSGSVSPSFEVPDVSPGATLTISAGLWNCAACAVVWDYEATIAGAAVAPGIEASNAPPAPSDSARPDSEISSTDALGSALGGLVAAVGIGLISVADAGSLAGSLVGRVPSSPGGAIQQISDARARPGSQPSSSVPPEPPSATGRPPPGGGAVTDAAVFDPRSPPGVPAVLNGGAGANPTTTFTAGTGSPGTCSAFGLPTYVVNAATRNLVIEDMIYGWSGRGPSIALRLTHNSLAGAGRLFGPGWHFSYDSHIERSGDTLYVWGGAGQTARFRVPLDGSAEAESIDDGERRLVRQADRWTLVEVGGAACHYTATSDGVLRLQWIVDRHQNGIYLEYDGHSRLTSITDPSGRRVCLTHTQDGRCGILRLPDSRFAEFSYDESGRLSRVLDLARIDATYEYDALGRIVALSVDRGRKTTRFAYAVDEPRPCVSAVTTADGGTTRYNLVSRDPRIVEVVQPSGATTRVTSRDGLTVGIEEAGGRTLRCEYQGRRPVVIHRGASRTIVDYDTTGRVRSVTDPTGIRRDLTRDLEGRVVAIGDSADTACHVTYNECGDPTSLAGGSGDLSTITYDHHGQPSTISDSLGATSVLERDEYGNVVAHHAPDGATTRFHYDAHGLRLTGMTDPIGAVTRLSLDANDRVVSVMNADDTTTRHEYSCCAGVRTFDEDGNTTTLRRDDLLRVTARTDPLGRWTIVTYDLDGRPLDVVDDIGRSRRRCYDAAGRLVGVVDPLGHTIGLGYDEDGHPNAVTSAVGGTTSYTRDALGRIVVVTDPLGRNQCVEYDAHGRVRERINGRGGHQRLLRDAAGRLKETSSDGAPPLRFDYDAAGRLAALDDCRGHTVWQRDANGRITEEVRDGGPIVHYDHDDAGRVVRLTFADDIAIDYDYDPRGRVVSAKWAGGWIEFGYDVTGRLITERRSNGVSSTYVRDELGRVVGLHHGTDRHTHANIRYVRDESGRVIEAAGIEPVSPAVIDRDEDSAHDTADQLDHVGAAKWHHDADGNVVGVDGVWRAEFDSASRLVKLQRGNRADEFLHDGFGRLAEHRSSNRTTGFHHDPAGRLLFETDESGSTQRYYIHRNDEIIGWVDAGGARFVHHDQGGNVIAVTDESGEMVAGFAYAPFGEIVARTGPEADRVDYTFSGVHGVRSWGDGWYATVNRMYHAPSGRFVQADPIGLHGGTNSYIYAGNDPVNRIDPAGTDWRSTWDAMRSDPLGWVDENVGRPGRQMITDFERTYVRPARDWLVGSSGAVDLGLAPGGFNTLNRIGPSIRPGVLPEMLPSAAQIRDATLRDTQTYIDFINSLPGTPQNTVQDLINLTRHVAEGDPRAILDIAAQAAGPLGATGINPNISLVVDGGALIKESIGWSDRATLVRDASRRVQRGCEAP